jgi:hypothetical protein
MTVDSVKTFTKWLVLSVSKGDRQLKSGIEEEKVAKGCCSKDPTITRHGIASKNKGTTNHVAVRLWGVGLLHPICPASIDWFSPLGRAGSPQLSDHSHSILIFFNQTERDFFVNMVLSVLHPLADTGKKESLTVE